MHLRIIRDKLLGQPRLLGISVLLLVHQFFFLLFEAVPRGLFTIILLKHLGVVVIVLKYSALIQVNLILRLDILHVVSFLDHHYDGLRSFRFTVLHGVFGLLVIVFITRLDTE